MPGELAYHPSEGKIGDLGVRVAAADVAVDTREPALFEDSEAVGGWGSFPDCGGEGLAMFV